MMATSSPSIFYLNLVESPPGVPFQKIQFGNERGGRSVLLDDSFLILILFRGNRQIPGLAPGPAYRENLGPT